jgi:hypothetical protein
VSAVLGSDWFENETVAGEPSLTGPLFPSVAVGGTLFTCTTVVYSL